VGHRHAASESRITEEAYGVASICTSFTVGLTTSVSGSQGECGESALNPNELEAVIKAVTLLAGLASSQRRDGGASVSEMLKDYRLYIPDDRSILVSMHECLFGGFQGLIPGGMDMDPEPPLPLEQMRPRGL
jgi:hypothetical protein